MKRPGEGAAIHAASIVVFAQTACSQSLDDIKTWVQVGDDRPITCLACIAEGF